MNDLYLDKKENKHLNKLQQKNALCDRKYEVSQLINDYKRYYGTWLKGQDDNNHFDSVHELKGELSFNDNTFEDGMEVQTKNYE